jgi:hypothetical protein
MKEDGTACNATLSQDKSPSTKSMSKHLFQKYGIQDPAKVESGLQDISVMIKKQKTEKVSYDNSKIFLNQYIKFKQFGCLLILLILLLMPTYPFHLLNNNHSGM